MKKIYTLAPGTPDERHVAISRAEDGLYTLTLNHDTDQARAVTVDAVSLPAGGLGLILDGRAYDIDGVMRDEIWTLLIRGEAVTRHVLDQRKLRMAQAAGKGVGATKPELETPMAGRVVALLVEPGEAVEEGQGVIIVEAMKMENELKAHKDGVVGDLKVSPGDAVDVGQTLLIIEDAPSNP